HHGRAGQISTELQLDGVKHTCARLSAIATGITIMGTIKNSMNATAQFFNLCAKPLVNTLQVLHRQQPLGQTSLMGGNDDFESGFGQCSYGSQTAGQWLPFRSGFYAAVLWIID